MFLPFSFPSFLAPFSFWCLSFSSVLCFLPFLAACLHSFLLSFLPLHYFRPHDDGDGDDDDVDEDDYDAGKSWMAVKIACRGIAVSRQKRWIEGVQCTMCNQPDDFQRFIGQSMITVFITVSVLERSDSI